MPDSFLTLPPSVLSPSTIPELRARAKIVGLSLLPFWLAALPLFPADPDLRRFLDREWIAKPNYRPLYS